MGYFREDYKYDTTTSATPDYLDEHNGRFCITPEYPMGIYCYFATVDSNWNSAYPYLVGPFFYGMKTAAKVTSITEAVTVYTNSNAGISVFEKEKLNVHVYPNPASDLVAVQVNNVSNDNLVVELFDLQGKMVQQTMIYQGSTIAYFDTRTVYAGDYIVKISKGTDALSKRITIVK